MTACGEKKKQRPGSFSFASGEKKKESPSQTNSTCGE